MIVTKNYMDIKIWLQEQIAQESGKQIADTSCDEEFENFDLDSLSLVSLSYELETKFDLDIGPTVFTEFNTINKLSEWVETQK